VRKFLLFFKQVVKLKSAQQNELSAGIIIIDYLYKSILLRPTVNRSNDKCFSFCSYCIMRRT